MDGQGDVYVVDADNSRIQKFTREGAFLAAWGSYGTGPGQFIEPTSVTVDPGGTVFVTDTGNRRIERFGADGGFLGAWDARTADGTLHPPGFAAAGGDALYVILGCTIAKFTSDGTHVTEWGSCGSGDGQFNGAGAVALGADGTVYVTDGGNNRIQRFSSTGTFLGHWVLGPGQSALGPYGIAIDAEGFVYVTLSTQHRVKKLAPDGSLLHAWGAPGNGNGQFDWPTGIAVDAAGDVYVSDTSNDRIEVFSQTVAVEPATWSAVKSLYRPGAR